MRVLVVDNGSVHLDELRQLLEGHEVIVRNHARIEASKVRRIDLIVLSGGHGFSVARHPEEYIRVTKLIQTTELPVIGICLGCEQIVSAFGGHLVRVPRRQSADVHLKWLEAKPAGLPDKPLVHEAHGWAIKKLPDVLVGVAKSGKGYEIIRHETKPIYGLQFHPEIERGSKDGQKIFRHLATELMKTRTTA